MNNAHDEIRLSYVHFFFFFFSFLLFIQCRISHPPDMKCVMPCDLRSNPVKIKMGNHSSHLCLELPMNIEGNIPVLWSFTNMMKQVKEDGHYGTMYSLYASVRCSTSHCIFMSLMTMFAFFLFPSFIGRLSFVIHRSYTSS
jgi:hypothetical protein